MKEKLTYFFIFFTYFPHLFSYSPRISSYFPPISSYPRAYTRDRTRNFSESRRGGGEGDPKILDLPMGKNFRG